MRRFAPQLIRLVIVTVESLSLLCVPPRATSGRQSEPGAQHTRTRLQRR